MESNFNPLSHAFLWVFDFDVIFECPIILFSIFADIGLLKPNKPEATRLVEERNYPDLKIPKLNQVLFNTLEGSN